MIVNNPEKGLRKEELDSLNETINSSQAKQVLQYFYDICLISPCLRPYTFRR